MLTATVLTVLLLWLFKTVAQVFVLLMLGVLISLFWGAVADWIERRTRAPERLALATAILGSVGMLVLLVWILAPPVIEQTRKLVEQLPTFVTAWETGIDSLARKFPALGDVLGPQKEHRTLTAIKPPVYDNSVTTGFYDDASRVLFSADCFGALLSDVPQCADDIPEAELRAGQTTWITVDSPWIHKVDRPTFSRELTDLRALEPSLVLSGHLPAASGAMLGRLLDTLATAPDAAPFAGPDQVALEEILRTEMAGAQQ